MTKAQLVEQLAELEYENGVLRAALERCEKVLRPLSEGGRMTLVVNSVVVPELNVAYADLKSVVFPPNGESD